MKWTAALLLSVLVPFGASADCAGIEGGETIAGERASVSMRTAPSVPRVDGFFVIEVQTCGRDGEPARLVAADAVMVAHGHGMNYTPEIEDRGEGRYRISGMLFHMQGRWELRFDVETAAGGERLTRGVDASF